MTREDFLAWQEHPITKWVCRAHEAYAEEQKAAWTEASWNGGVVSPELRLELHTRADAYMAISEATYEDYCKILGEDPKP